MLQHHKKNTVFLFLSLIIIICITNLSQFASPESKSKTIKYSALSTPISANRLGLTQCQKINKKGLENLNVYGSGIINFNDFMPTYKGDMSKVYVINLIPRPLYYHQNTYLKGYGNSKLDHLFNSPLYSHLKFFISQSLKQKHVISFQDLPQTEEEIIQSLGAHYFMPITKNTQWPTDVTYVDRFITFCENLPEDAVVYFHCAHGKGRTTTFMVLYDIFKNHKNNIPLEDIIQRHYCLGRQNLFDTRYRPNGTWTQEALLARKDFIVQFYTYMTSPDGYGHQSWSQWYKKQNFHVKPVKIHR